jgi:PTS system nitrogen regulatory IIA component
MDLAVKDVASLLNLSEDKVNRLIDEGKIPAYRMNEEYRFSLMEIETWVLQRSGSDEVDELSLEKKGTQQFNLFRALHKGGVVHGISGDTKEEVIRNTLLSLKAQIQTDPEEVSRLLLNREKLHSTALGDGVAIPHTRDFVLNSQNDVVFAVFLEKPIPYGALDGQPVDILFFLFASDDKKHLSLLAKLAHLSGDKESLKFIRQKPTKAALLNFVKTFETKISAVGE